MILNCITPDWLTPDWLMVIITGIYVIATIVICRANIKAANASKAQLAEMKKQYEEDMRPYIEAELIYERRMWYIVRFINHGKYTAQHVKINLSQDFIESLPEENIRTLLNKQKDKECIIGVGQHYDLFIGSNKLRGNPNMMPVTGVVTYQSNGNQYTTDLYIDLSNYMVFFSINSDHEDLMKALKAGTYELKGISQSIKLLNAQTEEEL